MSCCTTTRALPGSRGTKGDPGEDGAPGVNAFTFTTAGFSVPAIGGTGTINVLSTEWMVPNGTPASGQILHIQNAGDFVCQQVLTDTQLVIYHDAAYTANAPAGTAIPSNSKVSPSGVIGPQGASAIPIGGGVTGGNGDPNGIILAAGWWIYIDADTLSLWVHIDLAQTSVWYLKVA